MANSSGLLKPRRWVNALIWPSDKGFWSINTSATAAVSEKAAWPSIKSSKSSKRSESSRRKRAKWLSTPSCSGVAVSSKTPGVSWAKSATSSYLSLPPCSGSQCKWCASSTTKRSKPASIACSYKSWWSSNKSKLAIMHCSVANTFWSGLCSLIAAVRTKSNRAKFRLKRRRISTIHWYCKLSGTNINTRCALPVNNCWWIISPASMVFPKPTSSANKTRGAIRLPTSWAIYSWCGMMSTRAPIKPLSGWPASADCIRKMSWRSSYQSPRSTRPANKRSRGLAKVILAAKRVSIMPRGCPSTWYLITPITSSIPVTMCVFPSWSVISSPTLKVTRDKGAEFLAYTRVSSLWANKICTQRSSTSITTPKPSSASVSDK